MDMAVLHSFFVGKPQHATDDPWNKPMFPQILPIHPLRFRHWSSQRNQTSSEPVCQLSFKQVSKNPSLSLRIVNLSLGGQEETSAEAAGKHHALGVFISCPDMEGHRVISSTVEVCCRHQMSNKANPTLGDKLFFTYACSRRTKVMSKQILRTQF